MKKNEKTKHKDFIMIPLKMLKMDMSSASILLYGLILKMSYGDSEETYATNKTFAKYINKSERMVYRYIEELQKNKCIEIRYDEENPNIRYIKPLILNEIKYMKDKEEEKEEYIYNEKKGVYIGSKSGFEYLLPPK